MNFSQVLLSIYFFNAFVFRFHVTSLYLISILMVKVLTGMGKTNRVPLIFIVIMLLYPWMKHVNPPYRILQYFFYIHPLTNIHQIMITVQQNNTSDPSNFMFTYIHVVGTKFQIKLCKNML
jgi:hypothetical protein